jgi:hypothetical protein
MTLSLLATTVAAGMSQDHEHDARERERERPPQAPEVVPAPAPGPERLASSVGNRAMASTLAREGGGLLPGGRVHPDVESVIATRRGAGSSLNEGSRSRFSQDLGDNLGDVRVHTDATANDLARSVDARAFVTGSDVFFAQGEYKPGTTSGDRLLAHELTHVVQQRGAPTSGPLEVTDPAEPMEREADKVADELAG